MPMKGDKDENSRLFHVASYMLQQGRWFAIKDIANELDIPGKSAEAIIRRLRTSSYYITETRDADGTRAKLTRVLRIGQGTNGRTGALWAFALYKRPLPADFKQSTREMPNGYYRNGTARPERSFDGYDRY